MKWRVIPYKENSAAMNMALDEAILEKVAQGAPPVIRFYGWKPSAISIGYFQGYNNEVAEEACKENNVDVVRRITGGGAVYHEDEITYSLIAPQDLFNKDIIKSYEEICNCIVAALKKLGIDSSFMPINDIIASGKRFLVTPRPGGKEFFYNMVLFLYSVDVDKMFSLLKVGKEKIADKLIQSIKKRVTSVSDLSKVSREELIAALMDSFSDKKDVELSEYSDEELTRASELAEEKYSTAEWIKQR